MLPLLPRAPRALAPAPALALTLTLATAPIRGCKSARAVLKSTIDMLNAPNVEHLYVLGDKDVMPKDTNPEALTPT